jgi:hypothetical protein
MQKDKSTFVNVTYSAGEVLTKGNIYDIPANALMEASKGDWVMSDPEVLDSLKWLFPVKKNRVLGIFEVVDWHKIESLPQDSTREFRVRFTLRIPTDLRQAKSLKEAAQNQVGKTNFVVKYLDI